MTERVFKAVVTGSSAGGMDALIDVLGSLTDDFPIPILAVQHLHASDEGRFAERLDTIIPLSVTEAVDKTTPQSGCVYVAPANYHLLVERDGTLALSVDPLVNWSRPSIDVLFESAARSWGEGVIAVILSGANRDGARGIGFVRDFGGVTMAQDPTTATSPQMPRAAIETGKVETVLTAKEIGGRLHRLLMKKENEACRFASRRETS